MPGPEADAVNVGHGLTRPAFEHELAESLVAAGVGPGQGVQGQSLPAAGVGLVEGHPVGQVLERGPVQVDLDLVAGLRVEPRLGVQAVDVGVDVKDEDRAALARKNV